jgi:hypothetical protein
MPWTPRLKDADCLLEGPPTIERRQKPRIQARFIARVRGVDTAGEAFDADTLTDDLSASGLYLRIPRKIEVGGKIFIVIQLSDDKSIEDGQSGRIAIRAVVVRTDSYPDALLGVGVNFTNHRFI